MKKPSWDQSGRSLAELLIAVTIGLALVLAAISLYVANNQSYRVTDDKGRLEEEGRLALNLLAFHVRMAGYGQLINPDPNSNMSTTFLGPASVPVEGVQGCSGGFASAATVAYTCNNSSAPDGIIVRYYVDSYNANNTSGSTPAPTDCLGQGVTTSPTVVENRFYVASNPSTSRTELYCVGNGGTASVAATFSASPQPLAENIVDMRITYGYDADGDQTVDAFYTAQQIDSASLPTPSGSTKWSRVVSAKICLVARSANDNLTIAPQSYRDCSGNQVTATDRRLYGVYSTVVTMRSRASGSTL